MHTLLVEQRCPTCGSGELLEPLETFEPRVRDGEPDRLCVVCELEFFLATEAAR